VKAPPFFFALQKTPARGIKCKRKAKRYLI
jgi:hypothetical protein